MTSSAAPSDALAQLRQHFSVPNNEHNDRWDELWKQENFLPFDRGQPNPALVDTLKDRKDLVGDPMMHGGGARRKRALVPGCGRGYDVLLLSSLGYDAYGLEVSSNAVRACQNLADKEYEQYTSANSGSDHGKHTFIEGDFFDDAWLQKLDFSDSGFDLIYDYTFFCALPPARRPQWAMRMCKLLNPSRDSRLICVEFPTYKDPSTGGPPFGLTPDVYVAHLSRPGEDLPYTSDGYPERSSPETKLAKSRGLIRLDHWQPERTHAIGKGTDWVGVWTHCT